MIIIKALNIFISFQTQTTFLESRLSSLQNELDRAIECENVVRKALNDRKMSTSTELLSKLKVRLLYYFFNT